ncbi:venom dipeptidyl peptidase 4 [Teleopsis dalmanni]|uniref:venom dipeptidyl peptidase 4 n=1 Tax=Teleopsis dalmanni TaxID=139649 RepID=UPI0018CFD026|nr:venom dipeptidyl peptidase 4 [Teleopsis dalmanni]XP_037960327.1 venom dipeptidyl peptidase 4 [Teleopsis dalmanni]XP_037960328.1 venom dipeptidyl peptidase 4 [Teleopsis dalmanni]XP_037960329.1 venom dipeptidyl peptidase 4 [Teleopsis dalmanni]
MFWTRLLAILFAIGLANAGVVRQKEGRAVKEPWELLEALSANSQIRSFGGTWITDDEFYYTASDKSIHKYNAANTLDTVFVTSDFLEKYSSGSTFTLSPDNKKILVRYDVEEIFRHSLIAKYDVFDIETKNSININNGEKLQYCTWSPIKDRLSFVYDNNVYIHFEENLETPITSEGKNGIIYNGIPDWVYEEEVLSSGSAMWWSSDGLKLAVGVFNDTNVQSFKYFLYGEAEDMEYQYPKEVDLKYPKPGTENPAVALRIFDFSKVEPTSVRITAPIDIVSPDHILQNVAWSSKQEILVTWLNRRQNISSIQSCSIDGACREVKRIEEPNGWISMSTPRCLESGNNCLFANWIGNWYQVWNLDLQTGENVWKSRGNFTVLHVYGYDEKNDILYYQATLPSHPEVFHIFGNNECLSCNLQDVDGVDCRAASASFSKGFSHYAINCYGPNPSFTKIFRAKDRVEIKDWETNAAFRQKLETKLRPIVKFVNVTLADGSTGIAKLQLPPSFNDTLKYPMIVYVYGGPNSVRVGNSFTVGFDGYMTTKREVIYAIIDGRGTGNKGKELLFSVNNNLGEHEVEDQIYVTNHLIEQFPYIDKHRIGIWGWSYGGYMTAKTLGEDTAGVFQCGISVAPVTSWLYYDTIYTERYMGLPTPEDNLEKYKESSVLQQIENFRNHDFLLIHGSGDDNVHYQQSLMLAKVLQHNDILFEEMTYTDENHSIGNFQPHLYHTMEQFWNNCLGLDDIIEE